jgi:predicted enzyme related to lactoylglutathione lyase
MSYKLGMLSLFVRDVAQSTKFYASVLGVQFQPEFSRDGFAVGLLESGPSIALCSLAQLPADLPATPGGVEIQFEVEDIQRAWQAWKAQNVAGLTEIFDMGAGLAFSAKDPDGHRLAV